MSSSELASSLNRAFSHLMRSMRRIDDNQGIGRARLSALAVLVFGGPRSMSELADVEMVSAATMHHVVNGLLREGYITRRKDEDDGRRYILAPTRAGTTFMRRAQADRLSFLRSRLVRASKAEIRALEVAAKVMVKWSLE